MRINWKASLTAGALLISGAIVMNEFALGVAQETLPATRPQPTDPTRKPLVLPAGASPGPSSAADNAIPGASDPEVPGTRNLDANSPLAPNSDPFAPSLDPMRYPKGVDTFDPAPGEFQTQGVPSRRPQYSQEFLLSLNLLQNPEAEGPQRTAAREVVTKVLVEQFDEDMQSRQQQLEQLEKTLARLKAQFEKRKASRDQIVQLQLQLIENDAAGLGFPTSWNRMRGIGRWLEPGTDFFDSSHQLPPQGVPEPELFNSSQFERDFPKSVPRGSERQVNQPTFNPPPINDDRQPPAVDADSGFRRQDNQNQNGPLPSDSTI